MCSNCTNFTHVPFAQYLHHLMLCQCVEGNVKSTELSLKVVFYLSPSSALFREQCRFEWLGFDGSNIQRKHGARPKTIEANFWGEAIVPAHYLMGQKDPRHYRVSFWALVRNDLNKNCKVFQHFISTSYLFCHGVDESNINILFLSNTWDRVPFSQNRDLKTCFLRRGKAPWFLFWLTERTLKNLYSSHNFFNHLYFTFRL